MKTLLCEELGRPGKLRLRDVEPPTLAAGQARVQVEACGVNFPDVLMVAGEYQHRPELPFAPGFEVAGRIIETAAGVTGLDIGQRVLALLKSGGMAEQVCVDAGSVIPVPEQVDAATAAGILLTYGTALHALRQRAALRAGETLLVLGAAGGVGLAATEVGRLLGARVIAAASSADKLRLASSYGARDCIDYTRENLKERVMALTDGKGADVIFDPVGGPLFDQCLRCVAWAGRILVIGFASGEIQSIPANLPLLKGSSIIGVFWDRFGVEERQTFNENNNELLSLISEQKLKPHISATYPLADGAAAIAELAERRARGKVIVTVS